MLVGLVVPVLSARRAETCALRAAQDLVRQSKGDRVAGPCREVEAVVRQVGRAKLLLALGIVRLVLARRARHLQHRVAQAPVARTVQACGEPELEDRAGARLRVREPGGDLFGYGEAGLPFWPSSFLVTCFTDT